MARRGTGQRRLIVPGMLLMIGCPAAPAAGAVPARAGPAPVAQAQADRKVQNNDRLPGTPSPALLDYLGRYGEAADGLDPLGMALPDEPDAPRDTDKERQR